MRTKDALREFRLTKKAKFEDPIFGSLELPTIEMNSILDTFEFNRLHYVFQAGLQYMVRPSATYTRSIHSIGSAVLASKVFESISRNTLKINPNCEVDFESNKNITALSLMLHDIGHPPFSHVLEDLVKNRYGLDHEQIAYQLITGKGDACELFSKYYTSNVLELEDLGYSLLSQRLKELSEIVEIIDVNLLKPFITPLKGRERKESKEKLASESLNFCFTELVNGPIDIDRIDHLSRDIYFSGYNPSTFDPIKLTEYFCLVEDDGDYSIAIIDDGIPYILGMLLSREFLVKDVWNDIHIRGYEAMLKIAVEESFDELREELLPINDFQLINKLSEMSPDSISHKFAKRIQFRAQMYYPACEINLFERPEIVDKIDEKARKEIESEIAKRSHIENGENVILFVPKPPEIKELNIKIYDRSKEQTYILSTNPAYRRILDWIQNSSRRNWNLRVYCPLGSENDVKKVAMNVIGQYL